MKDGDEVMMMIDGRLRFITALYYYHGCNEYSHYERDMTYSYVSYINRTSLPPSPGMLIPSRVSHSATYRPSDLIKFSTFIHRFLPHTSLYLD